VSAESENRVRRLEGGWCLESIGATEPPIRLVFGDSELARAYPGLVVGREPALCDRVLDEPTISQRHCRFSVREARLLVEDLNSLNGTLVGGEDLFPFRPMALGGGEILTLGRLPLRVERIAPGSERG
jgi:predicted component of type VI protein secretion system